MKTKTSISCVLLALFLSLFQEVFSQNQYVLDGIVRGDTSKKQISIVLTGHEYAEGGWEILETLERNKIKASFFFTGDFYRNHEFEPLIKAIKNNGHFLGAHSDKHLLYCEWDDRSQLLIDRYTFSKDLLDNYSEMKRFGIEQENTKYFLPPYEWYNENISEWTRKLGFQLINFTPGPRTSADYTDPEMENYISSEDIMQSIWQCEFKDPNGLNGLILLIHIGVGEKRTDKFYKYLPDLIKGWQKSGYKIVPLETLLGD
ncbi:polysaccharide deacetylase family protein [Aquiflexum sp. TKW24L]|uniref:polysaccharide deacetylase family protein n=1 Tax=Aquiflexum sp. TKW24L TaxID=2942212 RepID=UPI0020C12726|nr:polysaccharide deacetylase family protein [Aquiflexum sp. TKW24L]MCL6260223.1 polysaccharide deacetylase family protein [Aquiflexum sp. TKW24L]